MKIKLSQETLKILNSFKTINSNLRVPGGNVLKTLTPSGSIISIAKIKETLPEFNMEDLVQFMNILSLFGEEPEIEIFDTYLTVQDGFRSTKIKHGAINDLNPIFKTLDRFDKIFDYDEYDVNFFLPYKDYSTVLKAASFVKSDKIFLETEKGKLFLLTATMNSKKELQNDFRVEIELEKPLAVEFRISLEIANLLIINGDYNVYISEKGFTKFSHNDVNITYFIAPIEQESFFKK